MISLALFVNFKNNAHKTAKKQLFLQKIKKIKYVYFTRSQDMKRVIGMVIIQHRIYMKK